MCWLDPLFYLKRPGNEYDPPHIDDTGARIFTLAELVDDDDDEPTADENVRESLESSVPSDTGSKNGTSIAPFSVLDRLKVSIP